MLGIHACIVLLIVVAAKRWAKAEYEKSLAIVGSLAILLFAICIGIPFFFQGYATSNVGDGTALGWTKNPVIGLFAYFYTFNSTAYAWLSLSVICIAIGRFSTRTIINAATKSILVLVACIMLTRVDAFGKTINLVLE